MKKYNIADAFAKQRNCEYILRALIVLNYGQFGLSLSDYEAIADTAEFDQKNKIK
jgi:hypothetical protein